MILSPGVTDADLQYTARHAQHVGLSAMRTDSRQLRSASHVMGARSAIRAYALAAVKHHAPRAAEFGVRIDADRATAYAAEIASVIADGLGYREEEGRVVHLDTRTDSHYLPGALTATSNEVIWPASTPHVVSEMLPVRSIAPWAELFDTNHGGRTGSAELWRPGMSKVSRADFEVAQSKRQVHTLVTSTHIDWMRAMTGAGNGPDISQVGEAAESARYALAELREQALVAGFTGIDWVGLAQLSAAKYHSTVDYTSTTIGAFYADMVAFIQTAREANDFRGAAPDSLMIGPRLMNKLRLLSNLDAGGTATGGAVLDDTLRKAGITRMVEAPSLRAPAFGGRGADYDGAVLYNAGQMGGLKQVVALAPAPVRTDDGLLGSETLWAFRSAGIEAPDATAVCLGDFQVA